MSKSSRAFERRTSDRAAGYGGMEKKPTNASIATLALADLGLDASIVRDVRWAESNTLPENRFYYFEEKEYLKDCQPTANRVGSSITILYYSDIRDFIDLKIKPIREQLGIRAKPMIIHHHAGFKLSGTITPSHRPGMARNGRINSWQGFGILCKSAEQKMLFKLAWENGHTES